MELVQRVELPGLPSSYHIVNSYQEKGKGGTVSVMIAKLREGGREKLEDTFRDLMTHRHVENIVGPEVLLIVGQMWLLVSGCASCVRVFHWRGGCRCQGVDWMIH